MQEEITVSFFMGYAGKINILVFIKGVEHRMEIEEAEKIIADGLSRGYEISKTYRQKYPRIKQKYENKN